ncbi:apoptosis inducing factor family protein [Hyphomicrobium facile]|uniref:Reductase C-terminal n=1 Tax=Hyphomicrobium facile TaxID=51670 RepID=A0A1I7NIC8_9HYPH|nr:apoptosis inducing factor family protein [Hyphomicrobium facile]SFV34316.1 Reductase C-terminal [Hyphomicrobium facile]
MSETAQPSGPDLTKGIAASELPTGAMLLGHVGDDAVLVARQGEEIFAIGAICTHYNGPLADGLLVEDTVRCPLHHACFSFRTGEALRAPALNPVSCWRVERDGDMLFVREKMKVDRRHAPSGADLGSVVIIGGGAAGNAAAEMLRRYGYDGRVTMLSADDALPYDRPNLSKDFLAGTAPADWIPLRSADFYEKRKIDVRLGARVASIDTTARIVTLEDGGRIEFDALLLATGASPVRLDIPGADLAKLRYLRTFDDSVALIDEAKTAKRVAVIGASFIGLETAAALRERGLEVHVIGPQSRPLERVLGPELGDMIKAIHEEHGVKFHFGTSAAAINERGVILKSGEAIEADLVVAGIGVHPDVALASQAGLRVDNGIVVDEYLRTSADGIFAAGDIARWPDPHTGSPIRVEHWVVAERQGQTAARNILGQNERFDAVPFFWSQHYDVAIRYVGHAERWDKIEIDGNPAARDCMVTYFQAGRKVAVATVSRDLANLRAEVELEQEIF